jgi:hypothetical protein
VTIIGGLGGFRHFDPGNLSHLIADRVQGEGNEKRQAVAAARGPLGIVPADEKVVGETMGAGPLVQRTSKYWWDSAWWGDQGNTSHCTAFAAMHAMADGPVTHPGQNPLVEPHAFFEEIRKVDLREGRDFGGDGATSLVMAKALYERGYIGEYVWGYSLTDFITAIKKGPVILGINWRAGMDTPDRKHGIIRYAGAIRGGHEIVANGADFDDGVVRLKQSWDRKSYGLNGHVYLPFEDLEQAIAEDGDVLTFFEKRTAKAA